MRAAAAPTCCSTSCRSRSTSRAIRCTASRASRPRRRSAGRARRGTRRDRERRSARAAAHPRRLPDRSARRQGAGRRPADAARDLRASRRFAASSPARNTCPATASTTAAALEAFARAKGGTVFHPAGTCRMGGDARSVVDERLRVRGVDGLRVIDASVMPRMVSTNTNAAAIMIGEKGAALVLEDARRRSASARARAARRRRRDPRQRHRCRSTSSSPTCSGSASSRASGRRARSCRRSSSWSPSSSVARVTVRQAIERLTRDGLVSPQRGRGTFVTGAPRADRWLRVETTLREPRRASTATPSRRSSTSTNRRRAARACATATASRRRALRLHAPRPCARRAGRTA